MIKLSLGNDLRGITSCKFLMPNELKLKVLSLHHNLNNEINQRITNKTIKI
jgi:hypothetical protein